MRTITPRIAIVLTGGEVADVTEFDAVLRGDIALQSFRDKLPENHDIKNGIMDKAYDSNPVRETLALNEMVAVAVLS